jgi:hypothetical protein
VKSSLTFKNIVSSVNKHKASSAGELLYNCGFTLRFVDNGKYRNVYEIVGSNYLVKVPVNGISRIRIASSAHARAEYEMYRRIKESKAKYKELQPYLMDEFAITRSGVIVVEKLNKLGKVSKDESVEMTRIAELAGSIMGRYCDLHDSNWMRDKQGKMKIVDFGYFLPNKNFKRKR